MSVRGSLVVATIAVAGLIAGCATPARTDQMVISASQVAQTTVPAALKGNIAIRDVTGGSDTNPLWMSSVGSAEFERALEESLRAAGMLQPNRQAGRYFLTAHLQKLDKPFLGFDMTVTATVDYVLTERATGKDVFRRVLETPYTAKVSDAFIGAERLKLANEGAMRANISRLIEDLSRLPLN